MAQQQFEQRTVEMGFHMVRVVAESLVVPGQCLVIFGQGAVGIAEIAVGVGVIGFETQRFLVALNRVVEPVHAAEDDAQIVVGFSIAGT